MALKQSKRLATSASVDCDAKKLKQNEVHLASLLHDNSQVTAVDSPPSQQVQELTCEMSSTKRARWFKNRQGQYRLEIMKLDECGQPTDSILILDEDQFLQLHKHFEAMQEALLDAERGENINIRIDLGQLIILSVKSDFMVIDIRRHFFPRQNAVTDNESSQKMQSMIATRRGISLTYKESLTFRKFCFNVALTIPPPLFYTNM